MNNTLTARICQLVDNVCIYAALLAISLMLNDSITGRNESSIVFCALVSSYTSAHLASNPIATLALDTRIPHFLSLLGQETQHRLIKSLVKPEHLRLGVAQKQGRPHRARAVMDS